MPGYCIIAGRCQDGFTEDDCKASKGSFGLGTCAERKPPDGPSCLMAAALPTAANNAIVTVALTYKHQVDFREQVLERSAIGKKFVKMYYEHKERMISLGLNNLGLLAEMFSAWIRIVNFVTATSAIAAGQKKSVPADHRKMTFTKAQHERCQGVLDRLGDCCDCEDFHELIDASKKELAHYVGLTPEQALAKIRRNDSKRKK